MSPLARSSFCPRGVVSCGFSPLKTKIPRVLRLVGPSSRQRLPPPFQALAPYMAAESPVESCPSSPENDSFLRSRPFREVWTFNSLVQMGVLRGLGCQYVCLCESKLFLKS